MLSRLFCLAFIVLVFSSFSSDPIERIGIKGPFTFNQTQFKLAWTAKPNDFYYIQEYLPAGEIPEKFNQMITYYLLDKNVEVKAAVSQKVKELENRKKTDPTCNYVVSESPDGKEFIVDFILSESQGNELSTVEFNVYRYQRVEIKPDQPGVLVCAYSKRAYENEITTFLNRLKDDRVAFINEMISLKIPTVKLSK